MKITIFGSGYVGLVTGACLADVGHEVMCVDVDADKVARLSQGEVPIYEPGLETLIHQNLDAGRLHFTNDAKAAVEFGLLQFIAVGTPSDEDGSADLRHVLKVAETIATHMTEYRIIVDKSTVPVGTASKVERTVAATLEARGAAIEFDVCSNPEFLKEGAAIEDFSRGSRIVIGTESERVRQTMRECYGPYNRQRDKLMFMGVRSAELTKYAANAMLATKISFINEMANLAERLGADIEEVRHGIGSDPRIGYHFIYPGCGYGGSCFPKDVKALAHTAEAAGHPAHLINAVEQVNARQKSRLFEMVSDAFDGDLAGKTIALWGLAFKPNTDDMREAPSRALMEALWQAGARVQAHDPEAAEECLRIYGNREDLDLTEHRDETLEDAHALVICTEWKAFRTVDFVKLRERLVEPVVVDGRNLFSPESARDAGLTYYAIGRGASVRPVVA
ncbi:MULTISPECIES: UDP-glucose dehydrogenase family protein [Halomonas]|uniref:UDP-glucose 6-dehydrogenase n=1 Tax=Halomonas halophila TaxID=29573 RepID=A0ABQ0UAH5_9GAMM|nr:MULTISPECIES: UDP-glucose/GDP-mannose dehydrogenase family protein [Halomonas]MDR5890345.1 UDP-glucose/GDP-mannose dehydrogenase family protein [Halomonas salina]WJY08164.1 UDP-glucose/GDP-mannose dehydrogenase family protein [Halomonas halophila]GEK74014.1 UDP-glucose 6-dehydrogenase [Halomonas halophila]